MKTFFNILAISLLSISLNAQTQVWDKLLKKHVDEEGWVDYKGFKQDEEQLNSYLSYLSKTNPNNWSADKQKAFWMNAYNAYTVMLILDNYPLGSITEIKKGGNNAWKIPFAKVGGKTYTLDHIEHEIIRKKFNDPRIHVGVNCASYSCPKLLNVAFTEGNVNSTLEKAFKEFVNDPKRNKISSNKAQLSSIFDWFKGDFTKNGSLVSYLNKYSNTKISSSTQISFLEYRWELNEKK